MYLPIHTNMHTICTHIHIYYTGLMSILTHVLEPPSGKLSEDDEEVEMDPGLLIIYDYEAIHIALPHAGAPVRVGADIAESAERFKEFVHRTIQATPVSEEEQCVVKRMFPGGGGWWSTLPKYSTDYHRTLSDW